MTRIALEPADPTCCLLAKNKLASPIFRFVRFCIVAGSLLQRFSTPAGELPELKVSPNHHFLVTESGQPFFWLGDTAWELFHRLDRADSERYLVNRAEKGFTLIQAVVLAELNGAREPNA